MAQRSSPAADTARYAANQARALTSVCAAGGSTRRSIPLSSSPLSGQLLIDLLRHETMPVRMAETARDVGAFVEQLAGRMPASSRC